MLQNVEDIRLARLLEAVKTIGIRFPIAKISEKTGVDKGNVSAILSGKKPISDNFLEKFDKAFNTTLSSMQYTPITTTRPGLMIGVPDEKERLILQLQEQVKQLQDEVKWLRSLVISPSEKRWFATPKNHPFPC